MILFTRRYAPLNQYRETRNLHRSSLVARSSSACAPLSRSRVPTQASSTWLKATGSPSSTGDYSLSWKDAPSEHDEFTLYECEGASSACSDLSSFTTVLTTGVRSYEFHAKAEGSYTYRVFSCFDTSWVPRSASCGYSSNVTVVVSYLAGTEAQSANAVGNMPYETGVTKGGDAFVNIPVQVVPGVNGLQPMLSIDYSDGRERQRADEDAPGDILGYGWRIGGLSAIRRCVKNTTDSNGISLDATDGLCLDGEPLVRVSGTHLEPAREVPDIA